MVASPSMNPEALLVELESCTHAQRMRRMVELGQRAARGDDPALAALLASLANHESAYPRLLALQSCMGSRDGAQVLRALADPSRTLRSRAAGVVPHACNDAEATVALGLVTGRRVRARLVAALVRRGRGGVVDAFLDARIAEKSRPDAHSADLLPFGSLPAVLRNLPAFRLATSPLGWARLSTRHPELAAAELRVAIEASPTIEPRVRATVDVTLDRITRLRPEAAVHLVRGLLEKGVEPTDTLVIDSLVLLARKAPCAIFDVLRAREASNGLTKPPGVFEATTFDRGAHRLGAARIGHLVRHAWSALPEGTEGRRWFLRLSPADQDEVLTAWMRDGKESWGAFLFRYVPVDGPRAQEREAAFQRWSHAARGASGVVYPEQIATLPLDLRVREANRHLHDVAALATYAGRRLGYAEYLPFERAQEVLATWLGDRDAERRGEALRVLLGTVRFERARMADALALCRRAKNEQDPVRLAIFPALERLPVGAFLAAHLEQLGGAIAEALDAADLSHATSVAIERLVVRLFQVDREWGARWLARLAETRGAVASRGLQHALTEADVVALAAALTPIVVSWVEHERSASLIALAESLQNRLSSVPALVDALERIASGTPLADVAASALGLLRAHAHRRFMALVAVLVAADPSIAILPLVAKYVSLRRQDLLYPLLGAAPMVGRFATGKTRWAIDFEVGHVRWTPRQHELHAATQAAILAPEGCPVPDARKALHALARLVFASPAPVLALASDPRSAVRDLAVIALSWLDQGQGTPMLLEALGDARARTAIHALRKVFQETNEARVLAWLRAAPRGKVTVGKEVARLLGTLGGEEAFADLMAMDQPGLHRDVRVAVLGAMNDHLDRPEAWTALERAAGDPDWAVASVLFRVPVGRLIAADDARLSGILARLLVRPGVEERSDLLLRVASLALADVERHLFGACLALMSSLDVRECGMAMTAVLGRMLPGEAELVASCIEALMKAPRVLGAILDELGNCVGVHAAPHRIQVARATVELLARDPRMAVKHLDLSSCVLTWRELADLLISLTSRDALHFDLMVQALEVTKACVEPELLEAALAKHSDARLRRLALCALETSAEREGWTPERRERLRVFRADFSSLVSGHAIFVFPPDEAAAE